MVKQMFTRCQQRLGAVYHVRECLGTRSLAAALLSQCVCEYGSVVTLGAPITIIQDGRETE